MNPHQFDALTKSLGHARSRRSVLTTLGAAALSAVGLAGTSRGADAAPGGNSAAAAFCATVFGDTKAAGQCTNAAAHDSGPYVACQGNPANYCNGSCTDVMTDRTNCGSCGTVCPGGDYCAAGSCVNPCAGGQNYCQDFTATCGGTCTCMAAQDGSGSYCSSGIGTCTTCNTNADCPAGYVCTDMFESFPNSQCGCQTTQRACLRPCGS